MLHESLQKAQKVVIGIKQTTRALESKEVRMVFLAQDAEAKLLKPIREMCAAKGIPIEEVATMKELGKACKIQVGAAAVAILGG
ncbi:MAG: 50S ribosomal protein L7Ae-like protein [Peptococcaceae bacterium]|jgi:large subunit ribosomal protein L7A|nr:50S ribosomal protein L7Ae-like protein [Peptococcaceae bacterium]